MENKTQNTHSPKNNSSFWFMNKIANPFVHLILSSPLNGWMSSSLLLITYQGRKSGKKFTIPVQYVQSDNYLYILPGAADQKIWWRNLRGGAPVEVTLRGNHLQSFAEVLTCDEDSGIIEEALKLFLGRFPAATRLHSIQLHANGTMDEEDLRRASTSVILVRVSLKQTNNSRIELPK